MSAISVVKEYRDVVGEYRNMDDSWPMAIWSAADVRGRLGCKLGEIGLNIAHTGDHICGQCGCKNAGGLSCQPPSLGGIARRARWAQSWVSPPRA